MANFKYTYEFEAENLAEATDHCQTLFDKDAVAVPAEKPSGTCLDLYLILALDSEDGFPIVVDTWTEIEIDMNPEGWEDACKAAKGKHSEVRTVVLPSRGLSEVFNVPRVGGGTAKPITE